MNIAKFSIVIKLRQYAIFIWTSNGGTLKLILIGEIQVQYSQHKYNNEEE